MLNFQPFIYLFWQKYTCKDFQEQFTNNFRWRASYLKTISHKVARHQKLKKRGEKFVLYLPSEDDVVDLDDALTLSMFQFFGFPHA